MSVFTHMLHIPAPTCPDLGLLFRWSYWYTTRQGPTDYLVDIALPAPDHETDPDRWHLEDNNQAFVTGNWLTDDAGNHWLYGIVDYPFEEETPPPITNRRYWAGRLNPINHRVEPIFYITDPLPYHPSDFGVNLFFGGILHGQPDGGGGLYVIAATPEISVPFTTAIVHWPGSGNVAYYNVAGGTYPHHWQRLCVAPETGATLLQSNDAYPSPWPSPDNSWFNFGYALLWHQADSWWSFGSGTFSALRPPNRDAFTFGLMRSAGDPSAGDDWNYVQVLSPWPLNTYDTDPDFGRHFDVFTVHSAWCERFGEGGGDVFFTMEFQLDTHRGYVPPNTTCVWRMDGAGAVHESFQIGPDPATGHTTHHSGPLAQVGGNLYLITFALSYDPMYGYPVPPGFDFTYPATMYLWRLVATGDPDTWTLVSSFTRQTLEWQHYITSTFIGTGGKLVLCQAVGGFRPYIPPSTEAYHLEVIIYDPVANTWKVCRIEDYNGGIDGQRLITRIIDAPP